MLELWLQFKKIDTIRWILKLLQWPALIIYRMLSLPEDSDLQQFQKIKKVEVCMRLTPSFELKQMIFVDAEEYPSKQS